MKFPWTKVAVIALMLFTVTKTNGLPLGLLDEGVEPWNNETIGVITERLDQMNFPFEVKYNVDVYNYIKRSSVNASFYLCNYLLINYLCYD